jgi:hypothetical protein
VSWAHGRKLELACRRPRYREEVKSSTVGVVH